MESQHHFDKQKVATESYIMKIRVIQSELDDLTVT